jgi:hypothetical protein
VSLSERQFTAPQSIYVCPCGHDHNEAVRLHEYGHVMFTPADGYARAPDLPRDLLNAVEDARLNVRLKAARHPMPAVLCPGTTAPMLNRVLASGNYLHLVQTMAAMCADDVGLQETWDWASAMAGPLAPYLRSAYYAIHSLWGTINHPTFTDTISVARKLLVIAQRMEREAQAAIDAETACQEAVQFEEGEAKDGDEADAVPVPNGIGWGPMDITHPPLDHLSRIAPERGWSARDEGTIPRAMHRAAVDGRVFGVPAKRKPGYAILVDGSGSMHWDRDQLRDMLAAAPASTVAIYCQHDGYSPTRGPARGELRIVGAGGKRAAPEQIVGGGEWGGHNFCDGPALRWLAKQPGKRIWLSDGQVNGVGGLGYSLQVDAANVMTHGKIMRLRNVESVLDVVRSRQRHIPTPARGLDADHYPDFGRRAD